MTGEPIKQVSLSLISSEVPDQGAFGCVFPKLFGLRHIVLHRTRPALVFPSFNPGTTRVMQTRGLRQARREPAGLLFSGDGSGAFVAPDPDNGQRGLFLDLAIPRTRQQPRRRSAFSTSAGRCNFATKALLDA
jgi:hypothetical protein